MVIVTVGAAGAAGAFDYTCDGNQDDVQIALALAACDPGDTVQLSAGTFDIYPAYLDVPTGVTLIGTVVSGSPATLLDSNDGANSSTTIRVYESAAVTDIKLIGRIKIYVLGNGATLSRIIAEGVKRFFHVFVLDAGDTGLSDILIDHCDAIDCSGTGFMCTTYGSSGDLTNITFSNCRAIRCGVSYDAEYVAGRDWITGFDLTAGHTLTVTNMQVVDCLAEENFTTGFHCEPQTAPAGTTGCMFVRCTSRRNGRMKGDPAYIVAPYPAYQGCAGFRLSDDWGMTDCVSEGDVIGISSFLGTDTAISGCTITDPLRCGLWRWWAYTWITSTFTADDCTISGVAATSPVYDPDLAAYVDTPNYTVVFEKMSHARITDLVALDCAAPIVEIGTCADNVVTYLNPTFAVEPAAPYAGQVVAFADARTFGAAGWLWTFDDGGASTLAAPAHTFATVGDHVVTMTVGGRTATMTIPVRGAVVYGGVELSHADLAPLDHDPVANATETKHGRVRLQGSPVSRRTWTINALADDHAEIEALAALTGQHLTLNINGTEYPGVMIRPPMLETQLTPAAWAYQIGFVQETRR